MSTVEEILNAVKSLPPEEQDPAVMTIDAKMASDMLDKMRESYRRMAEHMPTHAGFIADACPAS